jgi:hypothetical protein
MRRTETVNVNKLLTIGIGFAVAAVSLQIVSAQGPSLLGPDEQERETAHFVIIYDPDDEGRVDEIARIAESAYDDVVSQLGVAPHDKVTLVMIGSRRRFRAMVPLPQQDSLLGTYTKEPAGPGTILVDVSNTLEWAEKIITHEFTHAVVAAASQKTPGGVPLWFNEGLAVFMSDRYNPVLDQIVERAMLQGRLLRFDQIASSFPSDQEYASIAYAQSCSLVKRITWGKKKQRALAEIMRGLASGLTFDEAVRRATGRKTERIIQDWEKSIRRKSTWLRFWGVLPEAVFSLMGLLFIVAFGVTWRRRRREYRDKYKWELEFNPDEEPEEPWED